MYKEVLQNEDVQEIERIYDRKGVAFVPALEEAMNTTPASIFFGKKEDLVTHVATTLLEILNRELAKREPRTLTGKIIRGILKFITRK